ncbi:unnamed protein product [Hermetia illucens]|uniref:Cathepsin propeptide inhibitor domain-containing protein n=1 Tax=Hermetia illucens TaxID=343691 RepID=A0A7R8V725_HERIL|nr:uncharacterized protein LOC119659739 [Hermetia illucens]CAD7093292.1 unnamed protein product [Hermetia illucens]
MAHISDKEWEAYKKKYDKNYYSEEDCARREIYAENKKRIEKHNQLYRAGKESYAKGINQFTDMFAREVPKGYGRDRDRSECRREERRERFRKRVEGFKDRIGRFKDRVGDRITEGIENRKKRREKERDIRCGYDYSSEEEDSVESEQTCKMRGRPSGRESHSRYCR